MSSSTVESLRDDHERRLRFLNEIRREVGPEQRVSDVYSNDQLEHLYYEVMEGSED